MASPRKFPFDLKLPDQPRTTDVDLFEELSVIHNAIKIIADYATSVIVDQINASLAAGSGINLSYNPTTSIITIRFNDGTYGEITIGSSGTALTLTTTIKDFLVARANHTGTQAAGTITGLATVATSGSHEDLGSLQGGTSGEHQHLTNAQHTEATNARSSRGVDTTDDVIVDTATKGLVLKDTAGTPHYWRLSVSTLGVITAADLGTTKP